MTTIQPWPQPRYQLYPTVPDDRFLTQYAFARDSYERYLTALTIVLL